MVGRGSGGEQVTHLLQDFQVWQQGPNYAAAKFFQRCRNIVCRFVAGGGSGTADGGGNRGVGGGEGGEGGEGGHIVSSNIAPASLTVSVMHNRLIRAGMLGCQHFGIRPFQPATSNALMTGGKREEEGDI